jgi:hypothetical protein
MQPSQGGLNDFSSMFIIYFKSGLYKGEKRWRVRATISLVEWYRTWAAFASRHKMLYSMGKLLNPLPHEEIDI